MFRLQASHVTVWLFLLAVPQALHADPAAQTRCVNVTPPQPFVKINAEYLLYTYPVVPFRDKATGTLMVGLPGIARAFRYSNAGGRTRLGDYTSIIPWRVVYHSGHAPYQFASDMPFFASKSIHLTLRQLPWLEIQARNISQAKIPSEALNVVSGYQDGLISGVREGLVQPIRFSHYGPPLAAGQVRQLNVEMKQWEQTPFVARMVTPMCIISVPIAYSFVVATSGPPEIPDVQPSSRSPFPNSQSRICDR